MRLQTFILPVVFFASNYQASADIIIDFVQSGSGVEASWRTASGGPEIAQATIGVETLDLTFSGTPFFVNGMHSMPGLAIIYATEPSLYETLNFSGGNTLQLNRSFGGNTTLNTGGLYETTELIGGPNVIGGLNFSDLAVGTYVATTGDAAAFGTVTLNIGSASVPEPSHFAVIGILLAAGCYCKRRQLSIRALPVPMATADRSSNR